jgi:small GTP-binding protein
MEVSPFYKIKCLFAGESSVGKSSLVHLIHHDEPSRLSEPTIGIGFASSFIELEEYPLSNPSKLPNYYLEAKADCSKCSENYNQLVKLQIWDASGNMRFASILRTYMRDIDICFLVFDMSERTSWDQLPAWKAEVTKYSKWEKIPLFVLVGNKSDKKPQCISYKEIKERSEEWGIKFYILSAMQDSSSSMLRRMIYMSVQNFHDNMLLLAHENKPMPPHVTTSAYLKGVEKFLDLGVEGKSGYCCYQ